MYARPLECLCTEKDLASVTAVSIIGDPAIECKASVHCIGL